MNGHVVVDASFAAMWGVPEPYTPQALALASRWLEEKRQMVAPCLMLTEVANAFYKRVVRREMDIKVATDAMDVVLGFGVEIREEPGLHSRAMELSRELGRPAAYDGHYLALAEFLGCDLWTGDRRLYNAVKSRLSWVKWVGEYASGGG